jgi:hypothetical protein
MMFYLTTACSNVDDLVGDRFKSDIAELYRHRPLCHIPSQPHSRVCFLLACWISVQRKGFMSSISRMLIAGCTQDKRIVVYLNGYPHCLAIYTCDVAATNLGCELVTECNDFA